MTAEHSDAKIQASAERVAAEREQLAAERRAAGKCQQCGERPPTPGGKCCRECKKAAFAGL